MTETMTTTYAALAAIFDGTFKDVRGGVELEYVTGEQVVSRLNLVLGPDGWSFRVLEHGYHQEADEFWCLGEIAATIDGAPVTRQQFGSQKMKRSRASDTPLDIGFDLKGATTDALKKCASLLGVGLYLSRKEAPSSSEEASAVAPEGGFICTVCDKPLTATTFKDGTTMSAERLAGLGQRNHGRVLCMTHYAEAKRALQARQTQAEDPVPF
jgi:Rad52/22 family double-strand break repair protein